MSRAFLLIGSLLLICGSQYGQTPDSALNFDIASVRSSPIVRNPILRNQAPRGGRYEIRNATMLDLVRSAYGMIPDKVLGGPSWLELDRFDIDAKLPQATVPEDRRQMLQSLLRERFKLVVHNDTKPLPAYVLTAGKKPSLKEADGEGPSGCKPETSSGPPAEGGSRITMNGDTFNLGPGMSLHVICRNMTMESFAANIRMMVGAPNLGLNPVVDETGLKGKWNFDLRYSMQFFGPMLGGDGERISMMTAIEKLGLKLEERQVPSPVLIVDSVNRKPSADPPGVAEALPPIPMPTEFEVADIKQTAPDFRGGMNRTQNGRYTAQGMSLRNLVSQAFNLRNNREGVVGLPPSADSDRFDITAKVPSEAGQAAAVDYTSTAPMLRALLVDRFKMKYHTEDRPVSAYTLVAPKSKLKKADPESRSFCKQNNNSPGAAAGVMIVNCQNVTMEYFAEHLQDFAFGSFGWPVDDATGLEGGYDISFSFSPYAGMNFGGGGRGGGNNSVPVASDPSSGMTIFEAVEKLGLKLEQRKRTLPVIVIDHIEQKPTDN